MTSANISLACETISKGELASAAEWMLDSERLTKGPETVKFEEEFAAAVSARHAVYVNSGSSANLLVAAALSQSGRLRNNRVICPAVSWVTTVTPFTQLGFEVTLCDSDPSSLGLDVGHLKQLFEEQRPSVLVMVHVLGHPNAMDQIRQLAIEHDVIVIEDACEALGSSSPDGRPLGTHGLAGTFSFYYGHHISTIEGGMVVTNDFELYQLMLSIRSHGWSRDLDGGVQKRLTETHNVDDFRNLYTFYYEGFNLRPTDLHAFIGRSQLVGLQRLVDTRQRNFFQYRTELPGYWSQDSEFGTLSSFAYGTLLKNPAETAAALSRHGIESRPLICGNIGRHPFWTRKNGPQALPNADRVHDFGIYLPNHAELSSAQVTYVSDVFRTVAVPL